MSTTEEAGPLLLQDDYSEGSDYEVDSDEVDELMELSDEHPDGVDWNLFESEAKAQGKSQVEQVDAMIAEHMVEDDVPGSDWDSDVDSDDEMEQ